MSGLYSCDHADCMVVHEKLDCPLCAAEKKIEDLEGEVSSLEDEIKKLEEKE